MTKIGGLRYGNYPWEVTREVSTSLSISDQWSVVGPGGGASSIWKVSKRLHTPSMLIQCFANDRTSLGIPDSNDFPSDNVSPIEGIANAIDSFTRVSKPFQMASVPMTSISLFAFTGI